jgi:GxxExxY protein
MMHYFKNVEIPKEYPNKELAEIFFEALNEVFKNLGLGLNTSVYREALCYELRKQGVLCTLDFIAIIVYKGKNVGSSISSLLITKNDQSLLIDLINDFEINEGYVQKMHSSLRFSEYTIGIIVNFGHKEIETEIVVA